MELSTARRWKLKRERSKEKKAVDLWKTQLSLPQIHTTNYNKSCFIFYKILSKQRGELYTTIYDPKYEEHPVSGNRDFGYVENNDGSYTFYVRGVDRLTSWEGTFAQWMSDQIGNEEVVPGPFTFADNLWESFQTIVENYVDNNGGNATALPSVIARPQWEVIEDVVNGTKPLSTLNEDCD